MKKRLRKKKHVGEFKEYGVSLALKRNTKENFDQFLDAFIEDAVEANRCLCGGSGTDDGFRCFLQLGKKKDNPEEKLRAIIEWIKNRPDIEKYEFGEITDAWYGAPDEPDLGPAEVLK